MKAIILVSLFLTSLNAPRTTETYCYEGWYLDYHLAISKVYSRANTDLGQLVPLEIHSCEGWDPGYWHNKVTVRPLYNDSGLPVYEIFREEIYELVGFEFRLWDKCLNYPWGSHNGISIALSEEDRFHKGCKCADLTNW